jgi:rhodanese-related sulfurtransferase
MLVSPAELVATAKASIKEVSVTEFRHADQGAWVLVDLRDRDEYQAGHLPGAVCSPRGMLEFRIHELVEASAPDPDLPLEDTPIMLYCGTGGRSTLAAQALEAMGYRNVRSLAGGLTAWNAAGLPLE